MQGLRPVHGFATALAMISLVACGGGGSDGDDDGGGDVEISGGDVSGILDSMGSANSVGLGALDWLPGGASPSFDDDCIEYDPPNPEIDEDGNFDYGILLNGCEFPHPEYGTLTIEGSWRLQGSSNPSDDQVDEMVAICADVIEGLEDTIDDAGEAMFLFRWAASFVVTASDNADADIEVHDSTADFLMLERALLFASSYTFPVETENGAQLEGRVTSHLLWDFTDDQIDWESFCGVMLIELNDEDDQCVEVLRFQCGDQESMRFDMEKSGRTGTIDPDTGEVTFD